MNIKTLTFGCAALAASMVQAATVDFPKAGGDLASAADWGGALPAATDTAQVSKNGTYTLSTDVTFANLVSTASDALFDFTGHTVYPQTTGWAALITAMNTKLTVKGGTIQVDNGQTALLQGAANARLVLDGVTLKGTHSGDYDFTASGYNAGGVVVVSNKSTITCRSLYASLNGATGTRFEIVDGSKVYADYRVRTIKGGTGGDVGGDVIRIAGAGSLLRYTGNMYFDIGFNHTDETVIIDDYGELDATGKTLSLGNGANARQAKLMVCDNATATIGTLSGNSSDCSLLVSNAAFSATTFALGSTAECTGNIARFCNGATASFEAINVQGRYGRAQVCDGGSLTLKTLNFKESDNDLIVSNATFVCNPTKASEASSLGTSATVSNNVIRAIGADTVFSLHTNAGVYDLYGAGHHNTISIEGGAVWPITSNVMMTNTHHSVLRVTGANSRFGTDAGDGNFYIGCHKDFLSNWQDSVSNRVCVLDGAAFNVARFVMAGIGNRLVVSNATVTLTADSVGFRSGYENLVKVHDDNGLILQGTTPKVRSLSSTGQNAFWFQNNSLLRFEIPEEGYADGFVPIELGCAFYLDETNTRVEIECAKFVEKTGGKLHLIHAGGNISAAIVNFLKNNVVLPEGARLIIDGKDVYLKSPKRTGLSVIIR